MALRQPDSLNDSQVVKKFSIDSIKSVSVFYKFLKPYKISMFFGFLLLVVSSLVFMIFPVTSGELLNIATGKGKYGITLTQLGVGLIVVLILQSLVSYSRVLIFTHVSEKSMADIRKALYDKILTLPMNFFENNRVGELTSRVTSDVQQLQDALSLHVAEFIRQIIVLIVGIIVLVWTTPKLALMMFLIFPVIVVLAIVFGRFIRKFSKKRQEELALTNVILDESLGAIATVKAFTNEHYESARYGSAIDRVVKLSIRYGQWRGGFIAFVIAVLFGAIFFMLWEGATMVQTGAMLPGDLVSFIAITAIIGASIGGLGDLYTQLMRAVGSSERLLELLNENSEFHEIKKINLNADYKKLHGDLKFQNIHFSYPSRPEIEVLSGVDLTVPSGQRIALVGSSGAGKSTFVQLLLRFYDLTSGTISINDIDVNSIPILDYRSRIAVVPQEIVLFGGTIKENIQYGNPSASLEEIIEAAEKSYCMEFILQFPEGLDTVVGERGIKLSGGQRQRIAIARALLKNPDILILDEATSSLDAESESIVQLALEELMKNRTSIIIAHRLATIRNVDRIFVLEEGTIIEEGTHDELYKKEGGLYSKLAKLQFEPNL